MSIARRASGAWIVKYKDSSGTWKQRQFKTETAARDFDAAVSMEREKSRRLSLREVITSYIDNVPHVSSTTKQYQRLINGRARGDGEGYAQHLADRYADSLTRADLESVRGRMRAGGISTASINVYTGRLKAALSWAASEDLIPDNPWRRYRALPGAVHKSREATIEEVRAVYAHLPAWLQWAVKTAMALCLRPGLSELFALEWSAFDWRRGTVAVYMPKTSRKKLVFAPASYMREARERHAADPGQTYVCTGARGKRVRSKATYQKPWDRACKMAGFHIPFYSVRHVAASEMLACGADIAAVAAQLGHKDITTTGQFYTHAVARAQAAAAAMLPLVALVGDGGDIGQKLT